MPSPSSDRERLYGNWLIPEWLDMPEDWTEMVLHDTWVREDGAVKEMLLVLDPDGESGGSLDLDTEWIP